jgi:hypothetical protein
MPDGRDLRPRTLPIEDLEEYTGSVFPSAATVREIDCEVVNNRIYFFFSRGTYLVDLKSYVGGLPGLLGDVRTGKFIYTDDTSNRPDPPETPLSLNNRRFSYVIYKLSSKNWQFCRDHPPVSIGELGKAAGVYFNARRIDENGKEERVDIDRRLPVTDNCMVAHFIADGFKATGFTGSYTHALNLHVDLIYEERERAYIPLVIDPDVRNPGGSGS